MKIKNFIFICLFSFINLYGLNFNNKNIDFDYTWVKEKNFSNILIKYALEVGINIKKDNNKYFIYLYPDDELPDVVTIEHLNSRLVYHINRKRVLCRNFNSPNFIEVNDKYENIELDNINLMNTKYNYRCFMNW